VLRLVIARGMTLTLAGIGIGVVGAWGLTRFLSTLLYGVRPTDPVTLFAVCMVVSITACVAIYIPARRAAKLDPVVALRYE
jgi:ABC-type antimicrobial peptide transport system permease subunit